MRTEQPTKCLVLLQKLRVRLEPKNMFKPPSNSLLTVLRRKFYFCFSSPEPLGSQGELIVYPWSWRPSVRRRPSSTIFKDLL